MKSIGLEREWLLQQIDEQPCATNNATSNEAERLEFEKEEIILDSVGSVSLECLVYLKGPAFFNPTGSLPSLLELHADVQRPLEARSVEELLWNASQRAQNAEEFFKLALTHYPDKFQLNNRFYLALTDQRILLIQPTRFLRQRKVFQVPYYEISEVVENGDSLVLKGEDILMHVQLEAKNQWDRKSLHQEFGKKVQERSELERLGPLFQQKRRETWSANLTIDQVNFFESFYQKIKLLCQLRIEVVNEIEQHFVKAREENERLEKVERSKEPGGFIYFAEQESLLSERLQNPIPPKYIYIYSKAASLLGQGLASYRQADFFKYQLEDWNRNELDWGIDQIVFQLKGGHPEHPLKLSKQVFAEELLQTFHFKIITTEKESQRYSDDITELRFQHMVETSEITLYFKFGPREIGPSHKPPWAYWEKKQLPWQAIISNPQASSLDEITGCEGDFGLDPGNPIPVCGTLDSSRYLRRLKSECGSNIQIEKREYGGVRHPNVWGITDVYHIVYMSNGEPKSTKLYINIYHFRTSQRCPRGFRF